VRSKAADFLGRALGHADHTDVLASIQELCQHRRIASDIYKELK
jgi:hypothetical protein